MQIKVDVEVTFSINLIPSFACSWFVLKEILEVVIDCRGQFLLVCLLIFRCYLVTWKIRFRYLFLTDIRWVANHDIEAIVCTAENLYKGNIPDEGYNFCCVECCKNIV